MNRFLLFLIILLVGAASCGLFVFIYSHSPNAASGPISVVIPKGISSLDVAKGLADARVIRYHYLFWGIYYAKDQTRQFKAGEYVFAEGITPNEVVAKLVAGDVVVRKITVPEGYNVREIKELLLAEAALEGDITLSPAEGSLLPETYHYTLGDTRDEVLKRMQTSMEEVLIDAWNRRAADLPLQTIQEALILASIVEKETGVPEERPRVAAVFINRLQKGMRLQTDPSVIYGIEVETGVPLQRDLTRADLEKPTPYNTYVINGLPPTPIANPGRESIQAVLNPLQTNELYFVAAGNGGHNFAKTLEEHNRNVATYRATLKAAE